MLPDRGQHSIGYFWNCYLRAGAQNKVSQLTIDDFKVKTLEEWVDELTHVLKDDPASDLPSFSFDRAFAAIPFKGNPAILQDFYLASTNGWFTSNVQSQDVDQGFKQPLPTSFLFIPYQTGQVSPQQGTLEDAEKLGRDELQGEIDRAREEVRTWLTDRQRELNEKT